MTDEVRFLKKKKKKKKKQLKFGPKGPKSDPKLDFCHLLKFGSLVFLEIVFSDSLYSL